MKEVGQSLGFIKQLECKAFYLNIFNSVRSRDLNYFNIQQGKPVYWNQGYNISTGISISWERNGITAENKKGQLFQGI